MSWATTTPVETVAASENSSASIPRTQHALAFPAIGDTPQNVAKCKKSLHRPDEVLKPMFEALGRW